ncbi:predicted protein [Sclerotinia sclerotiorum 1980 UF-70]|uniref:Uncharacterized protein n=1 Tax=Sclerotinia sclerotiorum (strain ATCC 18683 / 1980 / Ss-1) TaxID=665079 RepID=A7F6L3_SCLS1|nr:predicted protein [Sclerotinia sclerotiorum 1980 UF-70]EDN98384.1 predicted protein [Sclerotinia sclerotiorum 1980 UF-70]
MPWLSCVTAKGRRKRKFEQQSFKEDAGITASDTGDGQLILRTEFFRRLFLIRYSTVISEFQTSSRRVWERQGFDTQE